jgi:hypothetical protein
MQNLYSTFHTERRKTKREGREVAIIPNTIFHPVHQREYCTSLLEVDSQAKVSRQRMSHLALCVYQLIERGGEC